MPEVEPEGMPLDGGVSSDIRVVHAASGSCVVKRALPKLDVRADWFADPARSSIEVRALRTAAALLGQAHVPRVFWSDEAGHRFAMELVGSRFRNWKRELLDGTVDLSSAHAAGEVLGRLHANSAADASLAAAFANLEPFVELRIQPYFERVAARNPALVDAVGAVVANMLAHRSALVHGDYSPKNLLVDRDEIVVLDWEVAHWGDPRFDVAFCAAHLLLKSHRRAAPAARLRTAALQFLVAYRRAGIAPIDADFARQLACLMLARLDGDSPVDYVADLDTNAVRHFATALLLDAPRDLEALISQGEPS